MTACSLLFPAVPLPIVIMSHRKGEVEHPRMDFHRQLINGRYWLNFDEIVNLLKCSVCRRKHDLE